MQEQSLKNYNDILNESLKKIIIFGQMSELFTIEEILKETREIDPRHNLILFYVYFILLTNEQKQFFLNIKEHVLSKLAIDSNIKLFTNPNYVTNILVDIDKNSDFAVEDKYLHILTTKIICQYLNDDFEKMKIEMIPEKKINILFESLFIRDYTKFNDTVLIALMIWQGVYNFKIDESPVLSNYIQDLIATLLHRQIYGVFHNFENNKNICDFEAEDNSSHSVNIEDYESKFYNMKTQ